MQRERLAPVTPACPDATARARPHVVVLPFQDRTSGIEHSWVSLGLMSATIDGLRRLEGLTVASAAEVLAIVGAGDADLALDETLARVARALGATDVLQARVEQEGAGIRVEYIGAGGCLGTIAGTVRGAEPVASSALLVAAIGEALASAGTLQAGDAAGRDDPFVTAARRRAVEAMDGERWQVARKLLRVALDARPDDLSLQMEYARCLVWLRDPQAAALLDSMRRSLDQRQDAPLRARVLQLLASHRQGRGQLIEARELFSQSLRIAEELQDQASELVALVSLGAILLEEGSASVGGWMLDRALLLAKSLGNHAVIARVHDIRGQLATLRGDPAAARIELERAAQTAEAAGLTASAAFSLCHLGQHGVGIGRLDEAVVAFDKSLDFALRSGHPVAIGLCGASTALCGGIWRGDDGHARRVVERLRAQGGEEETVVQSYADMVAAVLAARGGADASALEFVDRAARANARQGFQYFALRLRIRLLACQGALDEARSLCNELRTRATGRMRHQARLVTAHYKALIARIEGDDATALRLLWPLEGPVLPMFDQADALLDSAWLHLEAGQGERARVLLARIASFVDAGVASDYGPALLVKARVQYEAGLTCDAAVLQARYCAAMACPKDSAAAQLLERYRGALDGGWSTERLPRLHVLPSLFDLVPGLSFARARLTASCPRDNTGAHPRAKARERCGGAMSSSCIGHKSIMN